MRARARLARSAPTQTPFRPSLPLLNRLRSVRTTDQELDTECCPLSGDTRGGIEGPNAQHGRASGPRLRGMTGPWLRARDGVSAGAISVAFVRVASAWEATPWRGFLDSDRSGGHQRTSYLFVYSIYCTGGRWDCGEVREIEALWWWQAGFVQPLESWSEMQGLHREQLTSGRGRGRDARGVPQVGPATPSRDGPRWGLGR